MHKFMHTITSLNPIQEGLWTHSIQGVFEKSNFWTTDDKSWNLHENRHPYVMFQNTKQNWLKQLIMRIWRHNYAKIVTREKIDKDLILLRIDRYWVAVLISIHFELLIGCSVRKLGKSGNRQNSEFPKKAVLPS